MNLAVIGLVYLGYGLMFWGSTLLGGGPGNTGAWPLMYALFGIGDKPKTVSGGATGSTGGFATTAGGPENRWQAGAGDNQSQGSADMRQPGRPF